jgi:N-acetylmuramoyl-L-alanine amidase CwlA
MNLRPEHQASNSKEDAPTLESADAKSHVKTSVTLSRELAIKAREYVHQQQLLHARGERKDYYSFSQFFNEAIQQYLERLERGENHETHH